jgi:hypothetical protein
MGSRRPLAKNKDWSFYLFGDAKYNIQCSR